MEKVRLVTGTAGFVGSNVVHYSCRTYLNDLIMVPNALTYAGDHSNLDRIKNSGQCVFSRGDSLDQVYDPLTLNTEPFKKPTSYLLYTASLTASDPPCEKGKDDASFIIEYPEAKAAAHGGSLSLGVLMSRVFKKYGVLSLFGFGFGFGVNAQVPEEVHQPTTTKDQDVFFDVDLGLGLKQDQNANKASNSSERIDDVQLHSEISFLGAYSSEIVSQSLFDYDFVSDRYLNNTQKDDSRIQGESSILFGGHQTFYDLGITHSARMLLIDPTEVDLRANQDDRHITTVFGALRTAAKRDNVFSLGRSYTDITYTDFDINNSSRDLLYLAYTRNINAISSAGLTLAFAKSDFAVNNTADYTYKRETFFYSRQLRKLAYSLYAGRYQVDSSAKNMESDGFLGHADMNYSTGHIHFYVDAGRDVTDTSLGSNNNQYFSSAASVDGRIGIQDQILRRYMNTRASIDLSLVCDMRVEYGREDEDFFTFTDESSISKFASIGFTYHPRHNWSVLVHAKKTNFSYANRQDPNNYTFMAWRISTQFKDIIAQLNAGFFIELLDRDFDVSEGYSSTAIGFNLRYQLY